MKSQRVGRSIPESEVIGAVLIADTDASAFKTPATLALQFVGPASEAAAGFVASKAVGTSCRLDQAVFMRMQLLVAPLLALSQVDHRFCE